jgi:hypothetical protein
MKQILVIWHTQTDSRAADGATRLAAQRTADRAAADNDRPCRAIHIDHRLALVPWRFALSTAFQPLRHTASLSPHRISATAESYHSDSHVTNVD